MRVQAEIDLIWDCLIPDQGQENFLVASDRLRELEEDSLAECLVYLVKRNTRPYNWDISNNWNIVSPNKFKDPSTDLIGWLCYGDFYTMPWWTLPPKIYTRLDGFHHSVPSLSPSQQLSIDARIVQYKGWKKAILGLSRALSSLGVLPSQNPLCLSCRGFGMIQDPVSKIPPLLTHSECPSCKGTGL